MGHVSSVVPSLSVEALGPMRPLASQQLRRGNSGESREQTCLSAASFVATLLFRSMATRNPMNVICLCLLRADWKSLRPELCYYTNMVSQPWKISEAKKWWKTIHCLYLLPHLLSVISSTSMASELPHNALLMLGLSSDPALIKGIKRCDQIITTSTARSPRWQHSYFKFMLAHEVSVI